MRIMTLAILGGIALGGCYAEVSDDRDDRYRGDGRYGRYEHPQYRAERVVDPVCGTYVDTQSPWREEYQGRTYYFHDAECRERFRHHPHAYLDSRGRYPDAR